MATITPVDTSTDTQSGETFKLGQESARLVKTTDPKWLMIIGVFLAVVGLIALYSAVATTLFSVLFIGSLLIVSAISQVVYSFHSRSWKGALYHMAIAILYGVAGVAIVMSPVNGAAMITLLLAGTMLGSGLLRVVTALSGKFKNWGFALFSGLVSIGLAGYILSLWPLSSLLVLGVMVGVDLFFLGIYLTVLGASLKTAHASELDPSAAVSHA